MPSNWWQNTSPADNSPGGATVGGGGYGAAVVQYRDQLDARRSMAGQESQYPDGYLGTIIDRHQDKVLAEVQTRLTDRSYQRGVHLGSKIGQRQYEWDAAVNPLAGLQRQAETAVADPEGKILTARFAPSLDPVELLAHDGRVASLPPHQVDALARRYGVDPAKNPAMPVEPSVRAHMTKLLPTYR